MPGVRDTVQCSFSACRIGFRRCWHFVLCHKPLMFVVKDQYNILCLGLSGSGKSTILANLVGESSDNIEPTIGFNIKTLPLKDTMICIKEIGGSSNVQQFWDHYYSDKNAILFIVNAAGDDEELKFARETLKSILSHMRLRGKVCMILGTHSDMPNAKTNTDLEEYFQNVMHGHKWRVYCCSSYDRKSIISAFENLVDLMMANKV